MSSTPPWKSSSLRLCVIQDRDRGREEDETHACSRGCKALAQPHRLPLHGGRNCHASVLACVPFCFTDRKFCDVMCFLFIAHSRIFLIDFREREELGSQRQREREGRRKRETPVSRPPTHTLPDRAPDPHLLEYGMTLQPTEPPARVVLPVLFTSGRACIMLNAPQTPNERTEEHESRQHLPIRGSVTLLLQNLKHAFLIAP